MSKPRIRSLLAAGGKVNATDDQGRTPRSWAGDFGHGSESGDWLSETLLQLTSSFSARDNPAGFGRSRESCTEAMRGRLRAFRCRRMTRAASGAAGPRSITLAVSFFLGDYGA
jgi:hypothetical protein